MSKLRRLLDVHKRKGGGSWVGLYGMKVLITATSDARYLMYRGILKLQNVKTARVGDVSDVIGHDKSSRIIYKDEIADMAAVVEYAENNGIEKLDV